MSLNIIDMISQESNLFEYFKFALPFAIAMGVIYFIKNYKVNAIVYALFGILTTLTGSTGNFSGAIFICFSIYIFNTKKTNIILILLMVLSTAANYTMKGFTIADSLNNFAAYMFTIIIYFILIHPKKPSMIYHPKLDEENIEILEHLAGGLTNKEIADHVFLSQNAVTKRLKTMRDNFNVKSNCQLIYDLSLKGFFRHD